VEESPLLWSHFVL